MVSDDAMITVILSSLPPLDRSADRKLVAVSTVAVPAAAEATITKAAITKAAAATTVHSLVFGVRGQESGRGTGGCPPFVFVAAATSTLVTITSASDQAADPSSSTAIIIPRCCCCCCRGPRCRCSWCWCRRSRREYNLFRGETLLAFPRCDSPRSVSPPSVRSYEKRPDRGGR